MPSEITSPLFNRLVTTFISDGIHYLLGNLDIFNQCGRAKLFNNVVDVF